ncbi:MAG: hypothetical protein H3C34_09805 [Caldilineaceae bacterium]|nr:hypothetical protein [Caldilineaceae bacterium]
MAEPVGTYSLNMDRVVYESGAAKTGNAPVTAPAGLSPAASTLLVAGKTPHLAALLGYVLATAVFTWPLVLNLASAIPGDGFDGWQNYWNQWWLKLALVDRLTNPLVTDLLYHPTGVSLYFHTLNPFNGLVTLPVQLAAGLIVAYNAVVLLSWVMGGYGTFLLARWVIAAASPPAERLWTKPALTLLSPGFLAPFLAGLIFTLAPFHMAHLLGHMQVMSLEWIPFYVLYLLRALRQVEQRRSWRRSALLAALFLVLVGLCDWYYVLYLFLFTGLALLWIWLVEHGPRTPLRLLRLLAPPLVIGTLFSLVLSFWLVPMVLEATRFRFMIRPASDLYALSASPLDFLVPNRLHTLFRPGSFTWIGNQIAPISERTISIGYVALFLAAVGGLFAWRKARFWWVAAIFFFLLAMGPQWHVGDITWNDVPSTTLQGNGAPGWTPYSLLNQLIPFMRISRSVSRFAVMVQLCVAVLAAVGWVALARRWWHARAPQGRAVTGQAALGLLALGLVFFEYWVAPYPLTPPDTPAYYAALAADPDTRAVLNLPMNYDRPGYLLYQTVHGKPLTVAYISRDDPRTLTERVPVLQHFRHLGPDIIDIDPAAAGLTVLNDLGVGTVVLDRYKMPGGEERSYTEALAASLFAGQSPVYEDERITVFKVSAARPEPYVELGALNWGPLQQDMGEPAFRPLAHDPAELTVRHLPERAILHLRYHTSTDGGLRVAMAGADVPLVVLDPAPNGREAAIDLDGLAAAGSDLRLILQPSSADPVRIEQIRIEAP